MGNPFELKTKNELEEMEKRILKELIKVSGNIKLKLPNIEQWSAQKLDQAEGEVIYFLPELKVYVKTDE